MANCPVCGTYFVEGQSGYFGCCCKNCYEKHTDGKPWNRDIAEAGIDLAFKGIEAGANFLFGKKPKSSKKSNERTWDGMTWDEYRAYLLSPERAAEKKEYEEQQRKEWEGKEITTLDDYSYGREYKGEIPFTLEAYHEEIDFIFDLGVKEITNEFTLHSKPGAEMKNETKKTKILNELEKYREEQKEKLRLSFDTFKSGKFTEKAEIKNALLDFHRKAYNLAYESFKKANGFYIDSNFIGKKPGKIIRAAVCIPVSIIFFFLIFIFQRIGIVWGSIIAVAIIAEAMAITGPSDDWGNRISQIIFLPILGGIGGIIVGGIAWILSSFWTFVMVTWAIVMIGASLLLIFMDELEKL